jgi:hypothetical protein
MATEPDYVLAIDAWCIDCQAFIPVSVDTHVPRGQIAFPFRAATMYECPRCGLRGRLLIDLDSMSQPEPT